MVYLTRTSKLLHDVLSKRLNLFVYKLSAVPDESATFYEVCGNLFREYKSGDGMHFVVDSDEHVIVTTYINTLYADAFGVLLATIDSNLEYNVYVFCPACLSNMDDLVSDDDDDEGVENWCLEEVYHHATLDELCNSHAIVNVNYILNKGREMEEPVAFRERICGLLRELGGDNLSKSSEMEEPVVFRKRICELPGELGDRMS